MHAKARGRAVGPSIWVHVGGMTEQEHRYKQNVGIKAKRGNLINMKDIDADRSSKIHLQITNLFKHTETNT